MGIKVTQDINDRSFPVTVELGNGSKNNFTILAAIELREKLGKAILQYQTAKTAAELRTALNHANGS